MSDESINQFANRVIPVLKEFAEKFRDRQKLAATLRSQYLAISDHERHLPKAQAVSDQIDVVRSGFNPIFVAARRAAEQVSQRLEHSDMEEAIRLELRLRLAEFETELQAAQRAIAGIL